MTASPSSSSAPSRPRARVFGPERWWWALHAHPYLSLRSVWWQWLNDLTPPFPARVRDRQRQRARRYPAFPRAHPAALPDLYRDLHNPRQHDRGPNYFGIEVYRVNQPLPGGIPSDQGVGGPCRFELRSCCAGDWRWPCLARRAPVRWLREADATRPFESSVAGLKALEILEVRDEYVLARAGLVAGWLPRGRVELDLDQRPIVVRTYRAKTQELRRPCFRPTRRRLPCAAYYPSSQSWAAGSYGCGAFLLALLLCVLLIGILVFIYMLLVKPMGRSP